MKLNSKEQLFLISYIDLSNISQNRHMLQAYHFCIASSPWRAKYFRARMRERAQKISSWIWIACAMFCACANTRARVCANARKIFLRDRPSVENSKSFQYRAHYPCRDLFEKSQSLQCKASTPFGKFSSTGPQNVNIAIRIFFKNSKFPVHDPI